MLKLIFGADESVLVHWMFLPAQIFYLELRIQVDEVLKHDM
jgi:hypothetical protein